MWMVCGLVMVAGIVCFFMGYGFKVDTEPGTKMKIAITSGIVVLFGIFGLRTGQDAERSAVGLIARDGPENPLGEFEIYETLGAVPLSDEKENETVAIIRSRTGDVRAYWFKQAPPKVFKVVGEQGKTRTFQPLGEPSKQ